MDYDRVMVLDKGNIVEFDAVKSLLNNEKGIFYSMAKSAGLLKSNEHESDSEATDRDVESLNAD